MGSTPRAYLLYGVELGDDFTFDYDQPHPDWFDEDDPATSAERRLLAEVGFTEIDWRVEGYHKRKTAAQVEVGVTIEWYGGEDPAYLLAAVCHETTWDQTLHVTGLEVPQGADERLAWAMDVLGLTPEVRQPRWLLVADYG